MSLVSVRESFAAKLLVGLVVAVGLLLVVVFAAVRLETARQERQVADAAVARALSLFAELEESQRTQTDRLAASFVGAPRAFALVEEGAFTELAGEAVYQIDNAGLLGILLLAFTDGEGDVGLTILSDGSYVEADPVGIGSLAAELVEGTDFEAAGYRAMDESVYNVRARVLETPAGRLVGTVGFALPVTDEDVAHIGSLVGAEACFVIVGRCLAGSERARGELAPALLSAVTDSDEHRASTPDTEWSIRAVPLDPARPELGARVIAVPLDQVRAPFGRITRALAYGGGGALVIALLFGLALSRGLTHPVRALVRATGEVARGNFDARVDVRSRDEIGLLANAFNEMAHGLGLKEKYRSILNKVVSEEVAQELLRGDVELGGENRRVTVLFADIRGFTSLTEGMEPQGVIGLLNECMERLSAAVEAERGIVDKYVGDELMAVFGAPVGAPDDAYRAVRAALRMRDAIEELNRERTARGDAPIGLGVGLSTGLAVAGNMGSSNRLNYTVLGDIVNLGARLCSSAEAGEILMGEQTRAEVGARVEATPLGTKPFKGFRAEVQVFAVDGLATEGSADTAPRPARTLASIAVPWIVGAFLALVPSAGRAQEWPTLADLGLGYLSEDGSVQIDVSGQLDLEVLSLSGHEAGLAYGADTWVAPRIRLFTDVFLGSSFYGLVELRADRGSAPTNGVEDVRLEQAFARVTSADGAVALQVGRFASPFGTYAPRHLTEIDPFVRPPLAYDYRTVICRTVVPASASGFLTWRDDPAVFRSGAGAPAVWNVPYQLGAMVFGGVAGFQYRLAAMNSAPSSEVDAWADFDRLKHPSLVAGVQRALSPSLAVGASYNRGPYLEEGVAPYQRFAYDQEIFEIDATYARGPVMVRAEVLHDRWEVPNVRDDPVEWGYSLEVQGDVAAGLWIAGRLGALDFRPIHDELGDASSRSGGQAEWDYDIRRWEASAGYRLARNAGLVASLMHNVTSGTDPDDDLIAVRLWWRF